MHDPPENAAPPGLGSSRARKTKQCGTVEVGKCADAWMSSSEYAFPCARTWLTTNELCSVLAITDRTIRRWTKRCILERHARVHDLAVIENALETGGYRFGVPYPTLPGPIKVPELTAAVHLNEAGSRYLTTGQLIAELGVSRRTFARWMETGLVPHFRLFATGAHAPVRFLRAEVCRTLFWWRREHQPKLTIQRFPPLPSPTKSVGISVPSGLDDSGQLVPARRVRMAQAGHGAAINCHAEGIGWHQMS